MSMIKSFKHKGLKLFYLTGSVKGIQPKHAEKLADILFSLNAAGSADDLNQPSFRLHPLVGSLEGFWSIKVSGNWRITFRFDGVDVEVVDYQDYH